MILQCQLREVMHSQWSPLYPLPQWFQLSPWWWRILALIHHPACSPHIHSSMSNIGIHPLCIALHKWPKVFHPHIMCLRHYTISTLFLILTDLICCFCDVVHFWVELQEYYWQWFLSPQGWQETIVWSWYMCCEEMAIHSVPPIFTPPLMKAQVGVRNGCESWCGGSWPQPLSWKTPKMNFLLFH